MEREHCGCLGKKKKRIGDAGFHGNHLELFLIRNGWHCYVFTKGGISYSDLVLQRVSGKWPTVGRLQSTRSPT